MNKLIIRLLNKARWIYSKKSPSSSSERYFYIDDENFGGDTKYDYQQADQSGSDYLKKILSENQPCMICRFGSVEMEALLTYLNIIDDSNSLLKCVRYITGKNGRFWWEHHTKNAMAINSGFFPTTNSYLNRFGERYINDIKNIDVLGSWMVDEIRLQETFFPTAVRIQLSYLEPYYYQNPWSEVLRGKTVLVIHPFEESIQSQYTKRKVLFKDDRVLPDFELKTLKAVQSIANNQVNFSNWFEALDYMCERVANIEFDVAIIGAGAYGLPLASFVKKVGKKSVHLGGATQLLFGIRGKRWEEEDRNFYRQLFNEHWVRPLPSEMPPNFQKVEDGIYW